MALQLLNTFRKPHPGIIQDPDKRLRIVSEPVNKIDSSTKEIDKPFKFWLGMAAPQVGFNKRIVAIKESYLKYHVLVSPEITKQAWLLPTITGCYSLPGIYLRKSPYWIKLKYQDLKGNSHQTIFKGGQAVLIQQEIDHLNGVLACD